MKSISKELRVKVLKHIERDEIIVSSITAFELYFGAEKSSYPERNKAAVDLFLSGCKLASFDNSAAADAANIRAALGKVGAPIGPYDLMLAGHACSLKTTFVTNNLREFKRVDLLKVENWLTESSAN